MVSAQRPSFDDQQLDQTLASYAGEGDDSGQSLDLRFMRGVAKLVKRHANRGPIDDGSRSIFVMQSVPPDNLSSPISRTFQLDAADTTLEGRLWFVGPVPTGGSSTPLDSNDQEQIISMFEGLGLIDVPTVVYELIDGRAVVTFYPQGFRRLTESNVVWEEGTKVTLSDIKDVLDRVHRKQLVTPGVQSQFAKLWAKASAHHVDKQVELKVQMYLITALNGAFPTCSIFPEVPQASGRMDIEIVEQDSNDKHKVSRYAVLELKVLRSYGSTGAPTSQSETRNWLLDGVDQAFLYAKERGSERAALCCFDMRKDHENLKCVKDARAKAATVEVDVMVWRLYPTAKAYRSAGAVLAS